MNKNNKMTLHGCLRCFKYLVFGSNFVIWVTGMFVLGLALYLRVDTETNSYIQAAYRTQVSTYHLICYIFMATGCVMTFVGFLGCCGAFHESKCMLAVLFVFLTLLFLAEVAGGVFVYIHRLQIERSVQETFTTYVQEEYGRDVHFDGSIDLVQTNMECCGGEGAFEWKTSHWATSDPHHYSRVPDSCCRHNPQASKSPEGVCGVQGVWRQDQHPGVNSEGCGEKLVAYFKDKLWILTLAGVGVASVQFVSAVLSLSLCCAMRRQRYGGYKS